MCCYQARKDFLWQKQRELQDHQRQWLEEEIEVCCGGFHENQGSGVERGDRLALQQMAVGQNLLDSLVEMK